MTVSPANSMPSSPPSEKLSTATKISYGLGDVGGQMVWNLSSSYLVLFYTDSVGLAAAAVGTLMFVARITDAVFDPIWGAFTERRYTKHGRFRPWMIWGGPPLAIFTVLTFSTIPGTEGAKLAWAICTYMIQGLLYSVVNLPYGALATVMTRDSGDRVALNSYRMVGTNFGSIILGAITMPIVLHLSGGGGAATVGGFTATAALFSIAALPLFALVFVTSKEVVRPVPEETRVSLIDTFKTVLGNRPLMLITTMLICTMTSQFGRLAVAMYYIIYSIGRVDLAGWLMPIPPLFTIIGIAAFTRFAKKLGKKRMVMISILSSSISLLLLFFVGPSNLVAVVVLSMLYGLGLFATPIVLAMVPDAIDYQEDRTGVRSDGTSYAMTSLAIKVASALGGAIGAWCLAAFGYSADAAPTARALMGVNVAVNLMPAAILLLALIPLAAYPITEAKYQAIRARLESRTPSTGQSTEDQ
ncbi:MULTISPECIES: MFS transporter [unclassified Actinomyces]|uniref:MFS transporter n=1 Tax=unclassified Actinomyces TaxID=2609248 RepID=UPI0011BE1F8B|nr:MULTISPECIES: glycoside-pentoside-hexuronide (GPH):cation symporter [unclassified Actinomyces]